MDIFHIDNIPILAAEEALNSTDPLVIVIHGMSTTAETLRLGWPDDKQDGLARIYWRIPVLREGQENVLSRRNHDLFNDLFWPVVDESRRELTRLIAALGRPSVGLFGFSIGGLISLWGNSDNEQVRASVSVGGVPHLNYLLNFYPDYGWMTKEVIEKKALVDLRNHMETIALKPTLILHGLADDQAQWSWMEPFSQALVKASPSLHTVQTYPHVRHRLTGADNELEARELVSLREHATRWLREQLTGL
ncbi:alpha/beta hydrolase family protein [Alicyclobacillus mengziensis]|uniref:Prolyl oligopeptidase family serine peptidase n=1 Tax=Alicyclobacillus mengziensis TaxID=2931921 RepID=A0A9X7Z9A3_9BACL|nr:prolyl oligopeptidase family serine peptidase [Alicyclobacillus mengziensis]QSO49413.1 prolyl oligopeptidase family serine peptidase [Alicyclobacillus mengziensis]